MADKELDRIRAGIFAQKNKVRKSETLELFGEKVEVRQPTVGQLDRMAKNAGNIPAIMQVFIEYCYVPGTDTKIFTLEDVAALNELPSGDWLNNINAAIERLTSFNVKVAEKNLNETA